MTKDSIAINFMVENTPDWFVHLNNGEVDWQRVFDTGHMLSSGEKAVVAFVAHLLDRPGVVNEFADRRTLAAVLGDMDDDLRRDALMVLVQWAALVREENRG